MADIWLKKKCSNCTGTVPYLASWAKPPSLCKRCILLDYIYLRDMLFQYEQKHKKRKQRFLSEIDKELLEENNELLSKIKSVLDKVKQTHSQLCDEVLRDKALLKLAMMFVREKKWSMNSKKRSKGTTLPKSVCKFLQGGSPGLGRR
jgi:hypothetical protein